MRVPHSQIPALSHFYSEQMFLASEMLSLDINVRKKKKVLPSSLPRKACHAILDLALLLSYAEYSGFVSSLYSHTATINAI